MHCASILQFTGDVVSGWLSRCSWWRSAPAPWRAPCKEKKWAPGGIYKMAFWAMNRLISLTNFGCVAPLDNTSDLFKSGSTSRKTSSARQLRKTRLHASIIYFRSSLSLSYTATQSLLCRVIPTTSPRRLLSNIIKFLGMTIYLLQLNLSYMYI